MKSRELATQLETKQMENYRVAFIHPLPLPLLYRTMKSTESVAKVTGSGAVDWNAGSGTGRPVMLELDRISLGKSKICNQKISSLLFVID